MAGHGLRELCVVNNTSAIRSHCVSVRNPSVTEFLDDLLVEVVDSDADSASPDGAPVTPQAPPSPGPIVHAGPPAEPTRREGGRSRILNEKICARMRERKAIRARRLQQLRVSQVAVLMKAGRSKKWSRAAASVSNAWKDASGGCGRGRDVRAGRGKRTKRKHNSMGEDIATILMDGKGRNKNDTG